MHHLVSPQNSNRRELELDETSYNVRSDVVGVTSAIGFCSFPSKPRITTSIPCASKGGRIEDIGSPWIRSCQSAGTSTVLDALLISRQFVAQRRPHLERNVVYTRDADVLDCPDPRPVRYRNLFPRKRTKNAREHDEETPVVESRHVRRCDWVFLFQLDEKKSKFLHANERTEVLPEDLIHMRQHDLRFAQDRQPCLCERLTLNGRTPPTWTTGHGVRVFNHAVVNYARCGQVGR